MDPRRYYFSTRDLLMMAALAALGGVVSTYVNAIGDFFQSTKSMAPSAWSAPTPRPTAGCSNCKRSR